MRTTYRYVLFTITLLAGLALALPTAAQTGSALNYGDTVTGEITAEQWEVTYTFEGQAGDLIIISMIRLADGLDPYLELLLPDNQSGPFDDDSGGNLNSLLGPYTLPQDGTYTIVATRFNRQSGPSIGEYRLTLQRVEVTPLTLNQPVTVTLTADQPMILLSYDGEAGEMLTLTGEGLGGDTDYNVTVRDQNAANVNGMIGWPAGVAVLDPLVLEADGQYTFVVTRVEPSDTTITDAPSVQAALTLQPLQATPVSFDAPISGRLSDANPSDHYAFTGERGDQIHVEGAQTSGSISYEIQISTPSGYYFIGGGPACGCGEYPLGAEGDDNHFVIEPVLEDTGQYLIVVRRIDTTGAGITGEVDYTLTFGHTRTPQLLPGEVMTGVFDTSAYPSEQVYHFNGEAGMTVRVILRSENDSYAPSMDMQGPGEPTAWTGGSVWIVSVNSSNPGTAQYETVLPTEGVYLFRVRNGMNTYAAPVPEDGSTPDAGGAYSILIEIVE